MAWFGVGEPSYHDIDIRSIAERHGLKPRRFSHRLRFFCPFCGDDDRDRRRKGRTADAALHEENQPWKCWRASCGATGNARTLAAHYGELDLETHRKFESRPKPPPRPKPTEKATVRKGWQDLLESSTEDSAARIYHWAKETRGWPEEVARAVSYHDDVICPMPWEEHWGRAGKTLARHADREALRLLVPIRCHKGTVRSAMRMWLGPEAPPEGKRTKMALSSRLTGSSETWGSTMIYGSLPAAIEAVECGETIYIVEGAPDYLAASGLLLAGGEPGVVLGAFSAQTAKRMVERLLDELNRRNLIAERVVFVPDLDRARENPATGESYNPGLDAFAAAAGLLRGRAGVHLLKLPRESEAAKMDLARKLRDVGTRQTLALLRTAPVLYTAPVHLDRCQGEMSARFRRAVMEATQKAVDGKKTLVVYQVEMGVGKTRNALEEAAKIVTGESFIPVNGRRPRGYPASKWPPAERSVVFAASNHAEADEKMEELERVAPGARVRHIYGLLHYCQYNSNVEDAFPHVGRRGVCGDPKKENDCPHYQACPGSDEPRAYRGEVTFVAHALVGKMKADLVVIDESPGVIATEAVVDTEVRTLFASKSIPRVVKWRRHNNPDAGDAAQALAKLVSPIAHQHAARVTSGEIDAYSRRITGEELAQTLEQDPHLLPMLRQGFAKGAAKPPVPFPDEIRSGLHAQKYMPSMSAFNAMTYLLDYYLRIRGEHAAADDDALVVLGPDGRPVRQPPKPLVGIHLGVDGTWALEIRRVQKLPNCPVVILDATGSQTLAEWKAAYPDRKVVIRTLEVQGAGPATAVHMESPSFSRRGLIGADGGLRLDAVPKIEKVLEALAERTRRHHPRFAGSPPTRLGVLTHKPVADALLGMLQTPPGQRAHELVRRLEERGFEFKNEHGDPTIGWFGRHDRGTNAYRRVDGLIVIGDPVGNFGDIEQDAMLLDLDPGEISSARTAATCRQAIARARHIRRGADDRAVLIFAGRREPFLPGVRWERQTLKEGAAIHAKTRRLHELVLFVAHAEGVLGTEVVRGVNRAGTAWEDFDLDSVSAQALGRQIRKVATMRRWPRHTFQIPLETGGSVRTYLWAPTQDVARYWFETFHPASANVERVAPPAAPIAKGV